MSNKSKKKSAIIFCLICIIGLEGFPFVNTVNAAGSWWNTSSETANACSYLVNTLGFTKFAAAGILGNFRHESNVNPYVRERIGNHMTYSLGKEKADKLDPDNNGYGPGWGLAQWGDGSGAGGLGSGRWIELLRYTNTQKGTRYSTHYNDSFQYGVWSNEASLRSNIPNLYEQLDFVKYEMRLNSGYVSQIELNQMSSIDATANAVLSRYEKSSTKTLEQRTRNAYDIYYNNCKSVSGIDYIPSNVGNVDELSTKGNTLTVRGWHASTKANANMQRYMFIMDAATNQEITRLPISSVSRPDVAASFPHITAASTSGFNVNIPITDGMREKNIYAVTRYLKGTNSNESVEDFWFKNKFVNVAHENKGNIDQLSIVGNTLTVRGWHASTKANTNMQRYMFIMDAATNQEITRLPISGVSRPDVASSFSAITSASTSGFNVNVPITDAIRGKRVYVVTRYLKGANSNESVEDFWFKDKIVTVPDVVRENKGNIDQLSLVGNTLTVRGWHASTKANANMQRYMFVIDATTNQEITRLPISGVSRPDVAASFPAITSVSISGFNVNIPITDAIRGKRVYVVTRYLKGTNSNESVEDFWFKNKIVTV